VCRVGPSILHPGEQALFLNKGVPDNTDVTVYLGMVSVSGDPRIPIDNTYQMGVPGTKLVIDAAGIDQSQGKGQYLNECWFPNLASARVRAAPNGMPYLIVSTIGDQKRNKELETTYNRDYWLKKIQWDKLSEADKRLASEAYRILAPDMIIE